MKRPNRTVEWGMNAGSNLLSSFLFVALLAFVLAVPAASLAVSYTKEQYQLP
jgi:hypothetical protein